MEEIKEGQDFKVYVDFASTPNSLKNVLVHLRKETKNDLWVVFGAAGLRDRRKRPVMGETACRLADKVVLTAEDPRTEKVEEISAQIEAGCRNKEKIFKVPDRREAIKLVVDRAEKDDVIVICGKGHEKSMCFGKTEYPWSDQREAKKALRNRFKGLKV
jgi:UDP-N-acetylmuramoyl-L-alanyl-D-glutamate--2,6-diaminopimelate ligase